MDMNVTKETSQKQKYPNIDNQTESIKNSVKTEHSGELTRPVGETPSETPSDTSSADTKILTDNLKGSTKKTLTVQFRPATSAQVPAEYYQIVDFPHNFTTFQIFCDHPHTPSPPPTPPPPTPPSSTAPTTTPPRRTPTATSGLMDK